MQECVNNYARSIHVYLHKDTFYSFYVLHLFMTPFIINVIDKSNEEFMDREKVSCSNITMTDVAERAGVSQATVSRVLSNHPRINNYTRQTVMHAIQELGYRHVSLNGENGRVSAPTTLGLLICPLPEQKNPLGLDFFNEIIAGIQEVALDHHLEIVLATLPAGADKVMLANVTQERMAGLILLGYPSEQLTTRLREEKIKYVVVSGDDNIDDRSDMITVNNIEGSINACRYLLSRGCRRLGFIVSHQDSFRMTGFQVELLRHDLSIAEKDVSVVESTDISAFIEEIHCWINRGDLPDAIVISFYDAAMAVKTLLTLNGIKVPENVVLFSFKHRLSDDQIPCIHLSPSMLGKKAARRIMEMLRDPSDPPHRIVVPMQAIFNLTN